MTSACHYEIVASVVRWSRDHVVCGQRFERDFENRTRQVWAVAVEGNDASLMGVPWTILREVRKHRSEACGKTLTFLCHHLCLLTDQLRQLLYVRVRAHDGNVYMAQ